MPSVCVIHYQMYGFPACHCFPPERRPCRPRPPTFTHLGCSYNLSRVSQHRLAHFCTSSVSKCLCQYQSCLRSLPQCPVNLRRSFSLRVACTNREQDIHSTQEHSQIRHGNVARDWNVSTHVNLACVGSAVWTDHVDSLWVPSPGQEEGCKWWRFP